MEAKSNSVLKDKIKERCKAKGIQVKDAYKVLHVGRSKYYRQLDGQLNEKFTAKIAAFLEVPVETVLVWHGTLLDADVTNKSQLPQTQQHDTEVVPPPINSHPQENLVKPKLQQTNKALVVLLALCVLTASLFYGVKGLLASDKHIAEFSGLGVDYNLSPVNGVDDFHAAIYEYEFENVRVTIEGGKILIVCDVNTQSTLDPNVRYVAEFKATGEYLNGSAALNYRMIAEPNGEIWIGVMMLKIGTTGNAKGYWLTTHQDTASLKDGPFAFGDVNLIRLQEKIRAALH